jgi:glucose-6-phosphate-specific signal transduction histidine kinase
MYLLRPGETRRVWGDRRIAVVCAAALFLVVLLIRVRFGNESDPVVLLYALPTALLAFAFGLRGGLAGATISMGLYGGWAELAHTSASPFGWALRAFSLFLLGVLIGQAAEETTEMAEELVAREHRQMLLEARHRQHLRALEINDLFVQTLSAAKWKLEAGDNDAAITMVTEVIEGAQQIVSTLLPTSHTSTLD